MRRRRHISTLVLLRRTIEIKLQPVFLGAINLKEGDRHRLVGKSLDACGDGTRRLGGVDDLRGKPNNRSHGNQDGESSNPAKQPDSTTGNERGSDAQRKDRGNGSAGSRSAAPAQVMN